MSALSQFKQGMIRYRGTYAADTTYYPNNTVTYGNSTYICIKQSVGNLPTNTTYFSLFTSAPTIQVATVGSGTTPATFTLTSDGSTITLNKPS